MFINNMCPISPSHNLVVIPLRNHPLPSHGAQMFFQALAQLLILMSVGVEDLHRRGYMCLLLIHKGATFWLMYCLNACRITAFMYDSLPGSEKMASVNKFGAASDWRPPPSWVIVWAVIPVIPDITMMTEADKEKVTQLVRDIRNSVGPERFDKIMQLVQQVQLENQIQREPP